MKTLTEKVLPKSKLLRIDKKLVEQSPLFQEFEPVSIEDIPLNRFLPFDVYFPVVSGTSNSGVVFKEIISKGNEFTTKLKSFFLESGIKEVYIHKKEYEDFLNIALERISKMVENPYLKPDKKVEIIYRNAKYVIQMVVSDPQTSKNIERASSFIEHYTKLIVSHQVSASLISKCFSKDYNLFAHSIQSAFLAMAFAHFIKQPTHVIPVIGIGTFLHDVGKAEIPPEIINKPSKLTRKEFEIIMQHPQFGYDMLKDHKILQKDSLDIVLQHHERADGNGYPKGLKLHEISPLAQIAHIVDCYDAMTMTRPYKRALSPFETLRIMCIEMKGSFNMRLLELFIMFLGY